MSCSSSPQCFLSRGTQPSLVHICLHTAVEDVVICVRHRGRTSHSPPVTHFVLPHCVIIHLPHEVCCPVALLLWPDVWSAIAQHFVFSLSPPAVLKTRLHCILNCTFSTCLVITFTPSLPAVFIVRLNSLYYCLFFFSFV